GVAADVEEGRAHAFLLERVEDFWRIRGVRAVVEGEDHLVVSERYCPRVSLEADFEPTLRPDSDDARRPEPVGAAFGRRRGARAQSQRQKRAGRAIAFQNCASSLERNASF